MSTVVCTFHMISREMGVHLRGRDISVSQQLLHAAQVGAAFQQVRGERVTQRVGLHAPGDAGPPDVLAQDLPHAHAGEGGSPAR